MPTNRQRLTAVIASVAITLSGAWIASLVPSHAVTAASSASSADRLSVTITGVRNDTGKVIVLVFDNRDAFKAYDYQRAAGYQEIAAAAGDVAVTFPQLTKGPYAVAAYHDENGNRDFDMDGQTPREGYATSGATDAYDAPTFARASMPVGKLSIKMHYLSH